MSTTAKVSCPYCKHANIINVTNYDTGPDSLVGLQDICNKCHKNYDFDVEIRYLTVGFKKAGYD